VGLPIDYRTKTSKKCHTAQVLGQNLLVSPPLNFLDCVIISPKNTGLARNAEIIDNPRLIVSKQIT
jgi:hypothetical protein